MSIFSALVFTSPEIQETLPSELFTAVFLIVISLVLFLAIFMPYSSILLNIVSFAYPNARVRAIGNPCIRCRSLYEMAEMTTISEILEKSCQFLQGRDAYEMGDIEEIETALKLHYLMECKKTVETAPEGAKPFFRAYSMMREAESLKAAMRAKVAGFPEEMVESLLMPVSGITQETRQKIVASRDLQEIMHHLLNTPYGPALRSISAQSLENNAKNLLNMEMKLDRFVFEQLHASVFQADASMAVPIQAFVSTLSDITNLKIILRTKEDRIGDTRIREIFVPAGTHLPETLLRQMTESHNIEGALALLEGTPYNEVRDKAWSERDHDKGSISDLERVLDTILLKSVLTMDIINPHSAAPMIRYIVAKGFEIQNIRAILWSIHEQMPAEKIRRAMICGEAGA